jgi:hypothetical protein
MLVLRLIMLMSLSTLIEPISVSSAAVIDVCPIRIAVSPDGTYFDITHNGSYKRSLSVLEKELRGGCYNDANPSPVTAVILEIAPGAPREGIESLYKLLERNGWPPNKVRWESWSGLKPK